MITSKRVHPNSHVLTRVINSAGLLQMGKGSSCGCLDVSYDSDDNAVQTNGGCVSDHPDYPAWCDTSDSTWGYCGSVDDWYSSDATADNDADWMYTSGSVCPRGKVTTIATDDSFGPVPAAVVATMSQTGGKGMGTGGGGSSEYGSGTGGHSSALTSTLEGGTLSTVTVCHTVGSFEARCYAPMSQHRSAL